MRSKDDKPDFKIRRQLAGRIRMEQADLLLRIAASLVKGDPHKQHSLVNDYICKKLLPMDIAKLTQIANAKGNQNFTYFETGMKWVFLDQLKKEKGYPKYFEQFEDVLKTSKLSISGHQAFEISDLIKEWRQVVAKQGGEKARSIFDLALSDKNAFQIADDLDLKVKTIHNIRTVMRKILKKK